MAGVLQPLILRVMRPFETLLLFANLLAFFVIVISLPGAVRWMRHLAPVALLIAGVQALVEGPRWQMIPAYVLAALFLLIWLSSILRPGGVPVRQWLARLMMDVYMPADVVKAGLQQPGMWITRDAATMHLEHQRNGTWAEKDILLTIDTMRAVYENLPGDGYYVQIPGMFHVNFTDLPYWSPLMPLLGQTGPLDAQRGFDIVNAYSLAFFDKELKGQPSPLLDGPSKQYPEVIFELRRP
jgi:hypothetical protein